MLGVGSISHGVRFKSNRLLVGYSNKVCATISLVNLVGIIEDQKFCVWLGAYISPLQGLIVPSCIKDTGTQG